MEWTEGRKLASVTYNNKVTTFEYNHEGLRIKKTLSDGSYILYDIVDGVYVGETRYNASGSVAVYIRYILDEENAPVGISLWYPATGGWTDYHFVKNLQGDVLEVYKVSDGSLAASYTYYSWGNILSQSGSLASINPFRYRSYYYDTETWFYYLQSRYYDPAIGRFINADDADLLGANGDFAGLNLFAYCGNNPISRVDCSGYLWTNILIGAGIGAVAGIVGQVISDVITSIITQTPTVSNWQTYAGAALGGAAGGAVIATTGNLDAANAITGFVTTSSAQALEKVTHVNDRSWSEIGLNGLRDGAVSYGLGTFLSGVPKVTTGRNSMMAVYQAGLTKLRNNTASIMSSKVMAKGFTATVVGGLYLDVYYGCMQAT